jgi:hypothetical protein
MDLFDPIPTSNGCDVEDDGEAAAEIHIESSTKMLEAIIDSLTPPPSPVPQTEFCVPSVCEAECAELLWGQQEDCGNLQSRLHRDGDAAGTGAGAGSVAPSSLPYNRSDQPKWPSFGPAAINMSNNNKAVGHGNKRRRLGNEFEGKIVQDFTGMLAAATTSSVLAGAEQHMSDNLSNKCMLLPR